MDENQLYRLVEHARNHCPYYAFLQPFDSKNKEPIKDYLYQVPLLSRQTVQEQQVRLLSNVGGTSGWRRVQTSGRSGEPVTVILSQDAQAADAVLFSMYIDSLVGSEEWRQRKTYHLTLHAGSTSKTIRALWHDQGLVIKWNLVRAWQEPDNKFLEALNEIQGCVVTIIPSVAELLCSRLQNTKAKNIPRPLAVILSGEMVSTELKYEVSAIFNCPVSSLYTMAEVGIVGSEHPGESTYQVEDKSAVVEILDDDGNQSPDGEEGEIVVTPLNNYAMPLIRYRTGDRGYWIDSSVSPPIFRIVDARKPKFITATNGKAVSTIRFAKILASIGLNSYNIDQDKDDTVIFSYTSKSSNLGGDNAALIKTILRGALGPDISIIFHRVDKSKTQKKDTPLSTKINLIDAAPLDPDITDLAKWLRNRIQDIPDIKAAVLTGSSLDSASTTRHSDIDMIVMVENDPDAPKWSLLWRELKSHIPKLSINFDTLKDFSKRAPLITCRILSEQIPLIGTLDETTLPRPDLKDICLNGIFWTQDTVARIAHRVADSTNTSNTEPLFESWLAAKWIFQSLRYKYLSTGEKDTSINAILERLQSDQDIPENWKTELHEIANTSREIVPPPLFDRNEFERYSSLATSFVRSTQGHLTNIYNSTDLQ